MTGDDIILDKSVIIEHYLGITGRKVSIISGQNETEVYAVIEQTWKRNKSRFEENSSEIGRYYNSYYIYYGPASFNILELDDSARVEIDGIKYRFVQRDSVKAGDVVQYYRGVLKKEQEADGNVFI